MIFNNFKTIRDILRYAVTSFNTEKLFFGHGSDNAFDEAVYLILHTLRLPLDQLDQFVDANLSCNEINDLAQVINHRAKDRIPAAYITNEAWLSGYRFFVDRRVIIPRSFIAELILEQFSPWLEYPSNINYILDLCTGSGCLAILLANVFPQAKIDAVDISQAALEVAQKNIQDYMLEKRITLIQSNLYQELSGQSYDLIISNPPYVTTNSMYKLPIEYQHEPKLGLAGGIDGMDLVRKIVKYAKQHLTPQGALIVEIGNQRTYVEKIFPTLNLIWLNTSNKEDAVFLLKNQPL